MAVKVVCACGLTLELSESAAVWFPSSGLLCGRALTLPASAAHGRIGDFGGGIAGFGGGCRGPSGFP